MKILIVGSKGFIGSHALNFFGKKNGIEVFGADVVIDYVSGNYFLLDISNSDFVELFSTNNFDICINCSGAASVPDSMQHPFRDFSLNTFNVVKILEAIRKHNPECKLINISSAAVYGNPQKLPINEMDILAPVSPYGMHKLYTEQLIKEYCTFFNIKACSLRVFSAYGEGLKKQIFWDIYKKTINTKEIMLFGTGFETRDFINIQDILQSINILIEKGDFNAGIYNIANGEEIKIVEVATKILEAINYSGKLFFSGSEREGDPINWKADITKMSTLGYNQKIDLTTGINNYITWIKGEKLF